MEGEEKTELSHRTNAHAFHVHFVRVIFNGIDDQDKLEKTLRHLTDHRFRHQDKALSCKMVIDKALPRPAENLAWQPENSAPYIEETVKLLMHEARTYQGVVQVETALKEFPAEYKKVSEMLILKVKLLEEQIKSYQSVIQDFEAEGPHAWWSHVKEDLQDPPADDADVSSFV